MAMQAEEIVSRITTLHPSATIDVSGEDCSFAVHDRIRQFQLGNMRLAQSVLDQLVTCQTEIGLQEFHHIAG